MRELFDAVVQDPANRDASTELDALLTEQQDWTSLINLYVHLAEHTADTPEGSAWFRKAAGVAENHLDDAARAVELYGMSLGGDESHTLETLGRMRVLLHGLERWENLLEVSEAEAERTEDPSRRANLVYEMGEIFEEKVGDQESAMRCYQAAFQTDPGCLRALYAARRVYRQVGNAEMVAQLLDLELQTTEALERRAEILQELGNVLLYDLEQLALARQAFAGYLEIHPEDSEAAALVAELDGMLGDADEAGDEAEGEAADLAEAVEDVAGAADDVAQAVDEAAEAADQLQAEDDGAGEAEDLADAVSDVAAAADEVEQAVDDAAEAAEQMADAGDEADAEDDGAGSDEDDDAEAAGAEDDDAEGGDAEDDDAEAAEAADDDAEAGDDDALTEAAEAAEPTPPPADVEALLAAAGEAEGEARVALLVQAVAGLSGSGDASLAGVYLEAAKAAPGDPTLYWKVGASLKAPAETLQAIADGLDALAEGDPDGDGPAYEAHRLLFGATHLDEGRTVDYKLRELAKKSDHPGATAFQLQRLVETGKWRNVQQLLTDSLGGDPNTARVEALRQMARLAEERTDEDAKAADFWRQVHQVEKDDVEARDALLRLYEKLEKWNQYADVLRQAVDDIPDSDVEAKVAGLRKLVAVLTEHLRQDATVVQIYGQILELDPDDDEAREALVEKYEAMRRWPDLVGLLQQQADRASGAQRLALNLRIADLYLNKFRNQAEAIKAYEAVLEDDPDNRDALEALDQMYEKRRDWDSLVAVRRQLADMAEDVDAQVQAYKDLADYATKKMRRTEIALEVWEHVLALSDGDTDALEALVGLYEQAKDFDKLVETTDRLVEVVDDPAQKVDLLQKSGIVLQDRVGDKEAAVGVWQRLLAIEPDHRRAGDSLKKALIELNDWDALAVFFGERDKWDEYVRVLEGQVGVQQDDPTRIELLFRAATIWEENLEQQDRAVRALERVRQIEPENLRAARALEPIYSEHNDHRKLVDVLEVLLAHEEAPAERRALMMRSAQLAEEHLRNVEGAFEWVRKVVDEHPADAEARAELVRLGGQAGHWAMVHDDLVAALGRIPDAIADSGSDADPAAAQLDTLLTVAGILDEHMGAFEEALVRYHEALDIDPQNQQALDAVEAIYTRMMNWPELLTVLDRKLALADDLEVRKGLLRKQGLIFEEQLDDAMAAIDKYRAIVEEDEADAEALAALHRLYSASGQAEELHDVLQRQLQLAAVDEEAGDATAIKLSMGLLELDQLGQVSEAIAQFRDILAEEPTNEDARSALERLLSDMDYRAEVARILEPIYRDAAEWEALVGALEIQLEETVEPAHRVELLERIGTLHVDRTGDPGRAFEAFSRMLREQPDSRIAIDRLTQLADATDAWDRFARLLEEVLPNVADDVLARQLLARLAGVYDERLANIDMAVDAHRRVLDLDPDDRASIEALDQLYMRSQQWPELLAIYRRKLELAEAPEDREALQFQIANLLEEMLGDAHEAIQVYAEVLQGAPENTRALRALDRLYGQEAMWPELADALERQLALTEDADEQIELKVRLAALHHQQLGNLGLAIETYRSVLDAAPDNAAALEALETLIDEPDHRAAIADILEPIYEAKDDWAKLIEVYEIQREFSADDRRKVELLHRIARLHQERGGDAERAFHSYARAFQVDPSDAPTLAQLHTLAEVLGLWTELVDVYQGQVPHILDATVATDVHKRVARVLLEQLGDLNQSRHHYEAAYANDDTDLTVIAALEDIYFQTEQWHELVAVLLRKAELTEDAEARKDLYFRVSAIYEEMLEDPYRAVDIFQMVLEVDDTDARALDALERIFLTLQRWEDLMEVLHRKAALTDDLNARKDIYYVIGASYERELDDLMRAVETYQKVLEWDAADLPSLQSLDRLYQQLEHWEDLKDVLRRQVEVVEEPEAQLALRFRAARLHEEHLEDVGAAIEGYRGILADAPEHAPSLEALSTLVREDREAAAAAAVLEPVLTTAGDWTRMIDVWQDLLQVTIDLERRIELRTRIGQAHEDMLLDGEQAFAAYGKAFAEDPTNEATLASLERVAGRAESWGALVQLIEEQLVNIPSDLVARDLYLRVARVFEEELHSNVDAIERFRRVLELDPEHERAILALDRLYQKEGMWADLAENLQLQAERAEEAERVPLLLRLGTLFETALEDVPQAITAYRDVLLITPQQDEAVASLERLFEGGHEQPSIGEVLEPMYLENEDWTKLHGLLEALLAHQLPGEDRMRAMHRLAELCLEKLDDANRAFDWYGAAFKEVPEDEHSRREAARLAEQTDRFTDLMVVYTDGLNNSQDLELHRSVGHEMATVYRTHLDDDGAAERMYQYILEAIDPADTAALGGLDELFEAQQRYPELADVLRREIESTYDELERTRFMFRLGDVLETQLGEIEDAEEQYRGILDVEPHHAGALARLERIYAMREAWEPLFDVYARQSENAEDGDEKARLAAQMANLASEFLQRPEDAIDLWNQVLDLRNDDASALVALEALYQSLEMWRELVDVCERQVNLLPNDTAREIELYSKLGRVWGDYLDREENALDNWGKVLDRDPGNETALWAVRALHERTGNHPDLAQTNHRLLELLPGEDARRVDLFRQLGRLYQDALEQPADAIQAWTQLLAVETHDPEAIDALEELYTTAEDWGSCVMVLDRKVEITEDPYEQVSILFRIAEMNEERLGDAIAAQGAYARVLGIQPDNLDAYQQLERLYEAGEQHEQLVELLLSRLEHSADAFEQLDIYERTAKVFEQKLDQVESAFLVLGRAFEQSKDDERFGAELQRLAGVGGYWAELVGMYENVIQSMGQVPESVPLHLRVAQWYDEKLEQPQHAGTHYQYVIAIDPQNVPALTALELLLERFENWPKVAEVLATKIELSIDPDERKGSLEKLAKIQETHLDQPDAAIESYRQVLLIDGMDADALKALERLYTVRQKWQALIEVLDQQAAVLTDPTEIVENHLRVGELWETRLGSPERAIDAYRSALAVDDHCVDAMEALQKLYHQQDRWHELLDVYEMMLMVRTEPAEQLRVYSKIAMIQEEELADVYATIDTYRKMVGVDPRDPTAVRALDRLYRDQERWDELAEVYEQHLEVVDDPQTQVQVRTALADVYRGPVGDAQRAVDALAPVLDIEPGHRQTLQTLGELYAQLEQWDRCIDALSRLAHQLSDRTELLEVQFRVGRIYQQELGDLEQAETWFKGALEHDKNYVPALEALTEVASRRGDWPEVVRTLQMMEAATRSFPEKSKYLFQIGQVHADHIGDRTMAIDYFEQAMDMHPENVDAARPLVEVYWNDRNWPRAEPLLDLLLRTQGDGDIRALQELNFRVAYCAEQLHKDEKALSHYRQAYELDSTHLPTLRGMGQLLFRHEDWDRAFKIYQTVLVHHRESLQPDEVVEVFHRQGVIKQKVGERRKALDFFRKALELDPRHADTLGAIIELHEAQGDWEDVIHYRRQQAELLPEGERFTSLVKIGDVLQEQLRNGRMAVDAYNQALALQPGSKLVLGKLLGLHEEAGNWNDAVGVLTQLAENEEDGPRKAKYWAGVATLQQKYLKDHYNAVRSFDKALDADPTMLKAFQAIDQILTQDRDYERQDRYYRKMLKRATERGLDDQLVFNLAKNLGEINRSRLQKYDEALKAYKIALAKKPDDPGTHQIMAQLYELEDRVDKAIAQHYRLIEIDPRHIESYQHLRRLFMEAGRYDEAWCVCQVLTYLGHANQDERVFFEKYRSRTLTQARRSLDKQHWALINHPEKSVLLDHLFQRLYPYLMPLMTRSMKELRLNARKHKIETKEQTPFSNVLNYAAKTMRLTTLDVFRDPDARPGIRSAPMNPPAIIVGSDITSGLKLQELAFICSKQLYLMGQHHFLATIDETYEARKTRLVSSVYALMKLVNPQAQVQADPGLLEALQEIRIPQAELTEMTKLIQKMSQNPQQHLNVSKWLEMTEHSANRLGMLLANDIGAAIQVVKNEQGQFSKAPTQERVREIVLFGLSQNYFELRKALGLAIG
ncbi:MAG: tetratricopeptide repeat protein [Myxococcales bacterium]|nr:tetratricopeptide repeat protein [Myxococcales bacterium]